jgi:hypothetical protein
VEPTLDDLIRQLDGIGRLLMSIDSRLQRVVRILEEEDGEEEAEP